MSRHFLVFFIFLFCNELYAQNLALNSAYTFSQEPNYKNTSRDEKKILLVDGKYTNGYFWLQKTSVGWQNKSRIKVNLDIKRSSEIDYIIFNTARHSGAGVYYPKSVYVFGSLDNKSFVYLGDILKSEKNEAGTYNVQKFKLDLSIKNKFRYFQFHIVPQGLYAFVDEIEIVKARSEIVKKQVNYDISSTDLEEKVHSLLSNGKETSIYNPLVGGKSVQFSEPILFDWVNPWDIGDPQSYIIKNEYHTIPEKSILTGNTEYLSFYVTNNTNKEQHLKLDFTQSTKQNIEVFTIPPIESMKGRNLVSDPLVPVNSSTLFLPHEAKRFLIKLTALQEGKTQHNVILRLGNRELQTKFLVKNYVNNSKEELNANVWAYLNNPLIIKYKLAAVNDLKHHNINTVVVPAEKLGSFTGGSLKEFENYIQNFKSLSPSNIILFCNFLSKSNKKYFGKVGINSNQAKTEFKRWHTNIQKSLVKLGFKNYNLFIYPYDEITDSKDIKDFVSFAKWSKENIAGIKIFMTVGNKSINVNDHKEIVKYVDVIQYAESQQNYELAKASPSEVEKWIYDARPQAELVDPYGYYRLMGWRALYHDFRGIGFWSYSDYKARPFDDVIKDRKFKSSVNYSVIYIDNDVIRSSRRWEAFKLGTEDYKFLKNAASRLGEKRVKELVKRVIDSPNDKLMADRIKEELFKEMF